jgi:hypothetical protein
MIHAGKGRKRRGPDTVGIFKIRVYSIDFTMRGREAKGGGMNQAGFLEIFSDYI